MRTRLIIRKSNRYIYAQLVDPLGKTVAGTQGIKPEAVGGEIAKLGQKAKIKSVVFDRGVHRYHGQVKILADAARKGGLEF
ncbi:50S ribosomal protein L18 [Candidatus Amesbacteria bacterium]|nr:50S ribosomal protein L18 [Candidatus Amesbacteria bacterium]MBI2587568.1 50S ribosomal protein L18 [Candidatus Amesbacteria bacterium]